METPTHLFGGAITTVNSEPDDSRSIRNMPFVMEHAWDIVGISLFADIVNEMDASRGARAGTLGDRRSGTPLTDSRWNDGAVEFCGAVTGFRGAQLIKRKHMKMWGRFLKIE
jgi:hypothetical protein